jgi:hypothetical protein
MNLNTEKAERLVEIASEMSELLSEFKRICRENMHSSEYDQFKYRTLGHLEPALNEETEWYTRYSSIDSLEKVAQNAVEEVMMVGDAEEDEN